MAKLTELQKELAEEIREGMKRVLRDPGAGDQINVSQLSRVLGIDRRTIRKVYGGLPMYPHGRQHMLRVNDVARRMSELMEPLH